MSYLSKCTAQVRPFLSVIHKSFDKHMSLFQIFDQLYLCIHDLVSGRAFVFAILSRKLSGVMSGKLISYLQSAQAQDLRYRGLAKLRSGVQCKRCLM